MGDPLAILGVEDVSKFDQRGEPFFRVVGGRIDVGAFERGIAGDTNGDGRVDFVDFLMLSQNFGTGQSWTEGNFDGSDDGTQFADFLALSANFGLGVPQRSLAELQTFDMSSTDKERDGNIDVIGAQSTQLIDDLCAVHATTNLSHD